jgi:hypothetical protein
MRQFIPYESKTQYRALCQSIDDLKLDGKPVAALDKLVFEAEPTNLDVREIN